MTHILRRQPQPYGHDTSCPSSPQYHEKTNPCHEKINPCQEKTNPCHEKINP